MNNTSMLKVFFFFLSPRFGSVTKARAEGAVIKQNGQQN